MCRKCKTDFRPFRLIWSVISFVIALVLYETDVVFAIRKGNLMVPTSYTSGNGDLHVQLHSTQLIDTQKPMQDLRLQVTRLDDTTRTIIAIVDVLPDPRLNVTQITVSCQHLLYGGQYELEIVGNDIHSTLPDGQDERLRQQLDVRWPMPKLSVTPESIGTYPQTPVDVILEFPGVECAIGDVEVKNVPEFWLELYYCGHNVYCDSTNVTSSQVLYAEQVRGYPKARLIKLRCELFGLAGHYIVKLRPMHPVQPIVSATAYVKADWSEQFVFNVHARSISPCDPHIGIGVLFEYPACILDRADRVRLFAKLRADVASLAPPTSLHYVTEQRVVRGQHSLHFDCELFSEKYIEYCFVYVSQAISGAVADVRMDCLPTLPVSESDIGGWGPWSDWTPCSTTCAGGTRNRYRVCDNPPPRYGAKFCQGNKNKDKKAKGDGKENENQLSNLDQAFYETSIADLTQKLATCKEQNIKMQERMEEMDAQFKQFEEDRTDVTGYLDRSNLIKQANIIDLEEKLSELGKVRHEETKEFQRIIKEWEIKFKAMQEELTSEIKLLTGKLVSLEEFRIQRDELMSKFDQQESDLREQSQRHKDILQEMERKQIVDKNTLKNDVENKLLELSSEFTKASEVRISAHVQRLVRENIALNNELDRIMFTHRRLQNEMKSIKDRDKERNDATATYSSENKQLIRTCDVQIEIIKRLTAECEKMKLTNQVLMDAARSKENAEQRELKAVKELEEYRAKTHLLEQHVHAIRTECAKHKVIVQDQIDESERLANVLTQIKYTVKSACRGQNNPDDDPRFREAQRKNLLAELLGIFLTVDEPLPTKSFETIELVDDMYNKGDLGMAPSKSISSILRMRRPFARRFVSQIELGVKDEEDVRDDDSVQTIKSYPSCPIIDLESGSVVAYSNSGDGSKVDEQEVEETGFGDSSDDEEGDDEKTAEKAVKKKIQQKGSTEKEQDLEIDKKSTEIRSGSQKSQEKLNEKPLEREKSPSQKSLDPGPAVETQQCGGPVTGATWECMYGNGNFFTGDLPADRPEVKAEIGPGCRCGCIVHLSFSKPRRLIASSAQSCPGRTFWLIQADDGHRIRFSIDFFRLICPSQYLRIRDGDSLAAELIAEYIGGTDKLTQAVISSESQILLEFYSNELSTLGESCKGGFLTHAQQIQTDRSNVTISVTSRAIMPIDISPIAMKLTIVHIIAILFASIIIIVSALLGAQYVFRYRKYQLAESIGELDSPAHTPRASLSSIQQRAASRAGSTSTLFSEVVSLVKLRPRIGRKMKHSRLRESVDGEALESGDNNLQKSQSEDDISIESSHTLTNETLNDPNNPHSQSSKTPNSNEVSSEQSSASLSPSPCNNSISLPSTPLDTPIPMRRNIKKCLMGGDTKSMNGNGKRKKANDVSPVREEDTTETDTDSMSGSNRRLKKLSASNITLTNGCYSPAASMASTATIRTTNVKESKEKKNREKLLAGPGSEFSLANPEDFELDYYDYNVMNAGAAPGSYLGMDPAYLVWIPPLDEGDIMKDLEDDDAEPHYEEILPKYHSLDPGSNTETPSEDEAPNLPPLNSVMRHHDDDGSRYLKNEEISRIIAANALNEDDSPKRCPSQRSSCGDNINSKHRFDVIQMADFSAKNKKNSSPVRVHCRRIIEAEEKETAVVKSPSDSNLNEYYELDDIQFADDEDEHNGGVRDGDNKDKLSHVRDPQNIGKVK